MSEEEWLSGQDPQPMVVFLRDRRTSDRKMRLFGVACCRHALWAAWERGGGKYPLLLDHEDVRLALTTCEQYADGSVSPDGLRAIVDHIRREADLALGFTWQIIAALRSDTEFWLRESATKARTAREEAMMDLRELNDGYDQRRRQCEFLRDIFGNPFRPVTLDSAWVTPTVVALAQQMYESRDFTPMSILADALQDAGCEDARILEHSRGPGPHVKGCWLVDLVLGKA